MEFSFISGHVALDFVGTIGRWRTEPVDLLPEPGDLARWCVEAALVDDPPTVTDEDLANTHELRAAIYRLVKAGTEGDPGEAQDRRTVNLAAALPPVRLRLGDDGAARRSADIDASLSSIARATIELLTGPDRENMRECGQSECTRLYVDHSARRSRRWCDMRTCGNRAKAQSFRERHRSVGALDGTHGLLPDD
ncbi:CGNR zinc finger domain-containing protein [Amycolatopsis sp., V23-08]|uniref:CGNR zinc finger domain-containing protein n=1 Tax=Amycolatopsis heterodermiae TaxID=3110235 RepID=A0ABU5R3R2_9PSEU|nr:CGNR zinc finger domain-containing protein [Amycolatopsis sp., V23-08]MEA5360340.1 CGNR zinc finger domain-containing protein [Amycolatopsis sp., V23-08]